VLDDTQWPHDDDGKCCMSKDLGLTDRGCGTNKAGVAMKAQWMSLNGVPECGSPNSLRQH